jgi:hypothetical protein
VLRDFRLPLFLDGTHTCIVAMRNLGDNFI